LRRVLSPKDAREWETREFSAKDPEWRRRRRRQLLCLGCGELATFKMGAGVREPFFAARHSACCPLFKDDGAFFVIYNMALQAPRLPTLPAWPYEDIR
jgi:hypothetical protein